MQNICFTHQLGADVDAIADALQPGRQLHPAQARTALEGAVADLEAALKGVDGVDGLIHISQLSTEKVANVADVVSVGQVVDAKIIAIDQEKKKVSLSIRALLEAQDDAESAEDADAVEAPATEAAE